MPIYEYKCKRCRKVTEVMRSVTEFTKKIKCSCGKNADLRIPKNGAILTDGDVKWLESAKANLPKDAQQVRTRGEHRRYLRDHHLACIG